MPGSEETISASGRRHEFALYRKKTPVGHYWNCPKMLAVNALSNRRSGCLDLTGGYLNSLLERRTVELQEKAAELEKLLVAQYGT